MIIINAYSYTEYTHNYTYVATDILLFTHMLNVCMFTYTHSFTSTETHTCSHINVYICAYTHTIHTVCIYTCMRTFIYTYICIWNLRIYLKLIVHIDCSLLWLLYAKLYTYTYVHNMLVYVNSGKNLSKLHMYVVIH